MKILDDAKQRPDLFLWFGKIDKGDLLDWLNAHNYSVPNDLFKLWEQTGGGDFFESETILSPLENDRFIDDVESVNSFQQNQGFPKRFLIFHIGLGGFSALCLDTKDYVQINEQNYKISATYTSLDEWYEQALRNEYKKRYMLEE